MNLKGIVSHVTVFGGTDLLFRDMLFTVLKIEKPNLGFWKSDTLVLSLLGIVT